jgi:hypothetical protein
LYKAFAPVAQFEFKGSQLLALELLSQRLQRQRGGLILLSAPSKGDKIRNPVALQGEVLPSDLFGLAMAVDEGPLERAQEIGFGSLSRDAGRKVLARARASEAD